MLIDEITEDLEAVKQKVEELDGIDDGSRRLIISRIDDAITACDDSDCGDDEDDADDDM